MSFEDDIRDEVDLRTAFKVVEAEEQDEILEDLVLLSDAELERVITEAHLTMARAGTVSATAQALLLHRARQGEAVGVLQ